MWLETLVIVDNSSSYCFGVSPEKKITVLFDEEATSDEQEGNNECEQEIQCENCEEGSNVDLQDLMN